MGAPIAGAGCATRNDSATSAQVTDGSLRIMAGLQNTAYATYLTRTPSSDGNRQTYTISVWCRRNQLKGMPLGNGYDANTYALAGANDFKLLYESSVADALTAVDSTASFDVTTNAVYRDIAAWYHVVLAVDTTDGTNSNRVKLYVNGEEVTDLSSSTNNGAQSTWWNVSGQKMYLGAYINTSSGAGYSCRNIMSQFHFIDGLALGPGYFGYNDPLTNTWRPKEFSAEGTTVNDGTVWSSTGTLDTNAANAFDGNISNYAGTTSGTKYILNNVSVKINSSLKVYHNFNASNGCYFLLNGNRVTISGGGVGSNGAIVPGTGSGSGS